MGRDSDGFWTAPPARCFTQLWKRYSHPRARSHRGRQPPIGVGKLPTPIHSFLPSSPGTRISPRQFAYPNAQFPTPMPGPGAGGARSPVWRSEMRLSSRLERGLVERMVQNASESARIRPDPAQVAKLRRILDHPRAVPPGWGETQTDFGPPHPQDASPSCGSGTPTPVVRWRSRRTVRWRFPRPRPIASGQATTRLFAGFAGAQPAIGAGNHQALRGLRRGTTSHRGRQSPIGVGKSPTPIPGAGARQDPPHSSARPGTQRRTGSAEAA